MPLGVIPVVGITESYHTNWRTIMKDLIKTVRRLK